MEESLKAAEGKVSELEKNLVELKTQKETSNSTFSATIVDLNDQLKLAIDTNEDLKESLMKSQIEVLESGNEAFDNAKEQVLCLYPKWIYSRSTTSRS